MCLSTLLSHTYNYMSFSRRVQERQKEEEWSQWATSSGNYGNFWADKARKSQEEMQARVKKTMNESNDRKEVRQFY